LRAADLIDALVRAGLVVRDDGDCATWRWRPDRENRRAQNLPQVVAIVRDTAERVAAAANELTLVLGGACTMEIGTVAGQRPPQCARLDGHGAHAPRGRCCT
jgi:arginase